MQKNDIIISDESSKKIITLNSNYWEAIRENAISASEIIRNNEMDSVWKSIEDTKIYGLSIVGWDLLDDSEYTSGTGISINANHG